LVALVQGMPGGYRHFLFSVLPQMALITQILLRNNRSSKQSSFFSKIQEPDTHFIEIGIFIYPKLQHISVTEINLDLIASSSPNAHALPARG
jgi:hypothetical protein